MDSNSLVIYGFSLGAITAVLLIGVFAAGGAILWLAAEKIFDYIENRKK